MLDRSGGAQDIGDADALLLARKRVAAARSAHAMEDAFMHQGLQHRLEMTRRQIVPRGELTRGQRMLARVKRDVYNGSDGKETLAGQ
jgi:hypothetical protein